MNLVRTCRHVRIFAATLAGIAAVTFGVGPIQAQLGKGPPITPHDIIVPHDLTIPRDVTIPDVIDPSSQSLPSIESAPSTPSIESLPSTSPLSKQPMVPGLRSTPGTAFIVNEGDRPLHFAIRQPRAAWSSYTVGVGQSTSISCDGCGAGALEFSMTTEGYEVRYGLDTGKRYALRWNESRHIWDVYYVR